MNLADAERIAVIEDFVAAINAARPPDVLLNASSLDQSAGLLKSSLDHYAETWEQEFGLLSRQLLSLHGGQTSTAAGSVSPGIVMHKAMSKLGTGIGSIVKVGNNRKVNIASLCLEVKFGGYDESARTEICHKVDGDFELSIIDFSQKNWRLKIEEDNHRATTIWDETHADLQSVGIKLLEFGINVRPLMLYECGTAMVASPLPHRKNYHAFKSKQIMWQLHMDKPLIDAAAFVFPRLVRSR